MNDSLFSTFLDNLSPHALAHMVIDLEQAQEGWLHYPEEAPPETKRQALQSLSPIILEAGKKQAEQWDLNFEQLVEQLRTEREEADWASERDRQEIQNWTTDFD